MKDFPYKVLLTDKRTIWPARKWCYTEFGLLGLKWVKFQRPPCRAYDLKKGNWHHRMKSNPLSFHFKYPEDAVAFKLRWS